MLLFRVVDIRLRHWAVAQKLAMIEEICAEDKSVSSITHCHGAVPIFSVTGRVYCRTVEKQQLVEITLVSSQKVRCPEEWGWELGRSVSCKILGPRSSKRLLSGTCQKRRCGSIGCRNVFNTHISSALFITMRLSLNRHSSELEVATYETAAMI